MTTLPIIKQNYFLYQPVEDESDYVYTAGKGQVMNAFFPEKGWQKTGKYLNKLNAMRDLNNVDPGLLVIYGHGNLGAGIGTSKKHYGPSQLVKKLKQLKLARNQRNLTIYLWACNTAATDIEVQGKSYALRFAEALASAGYSGVRVVGIAGFISTTATYTSLVYDGKRDIKCVEENPPVQPTDSDRHTLYQVQDGEVIGIRTPVWHWKGPENKVYTTWKVEETTPHNEGVLHSINLKTDHGISFSNMKEWMHKLEQETNEKISGLESKIASLEKENAALRGHSRIESSVNDKKESNFDENNGIMWT